MPPEVVKQTGHNRYADIWSLGCTVFELLVGNPPWSEKKDIVSVLMSIANATEPPKLPNKEMVSPNLRSFLEACFRREPHHRPNVYELLRHPFIVEMPKPVKNPSPIFIQPIKTDTSKLSTPIQITLDKIEEEATPVPSNSEYSRKQGRISSRAQS